MNQSKIENSRMKKNLFLALRMDGSNRLSKETLRVTLKKRWTALEKRTRYIKWVEKDIFKNEVIKVKRDLFEGIFLTLDERNGHKSRSVQKRLLRRIVEKRLAQASHRRIGRMNGALIGYFIKSNVGKSMESLRRYQACI